MNFDDDQTVSFCIGDYFLNYVLILRLNSTNFMRKLKAKIGIHFIVI